MGHRANYVIADDTGFRLFESQWGGLSLARDLLAGPDRAIAHFRAQRPVETWLASFTCDGAALVDLRARRLHFYATTTIPELLRPAARRLYFARLRERWPGWSVDWAYEGSFELAARVGLDESVVETIDEPRDPSLIRDLEDPWSLITVTPAEGRPRHHPLRDGVDDLLRLGPRLLPVLSAIAPCDRLALDEAPDDGGVVIDLRDRRIDYWCSGYPRKGIGSLAARCFPGWSAEFHEDRYEDQVARADGTLSIATGDARRANHDIDTMLAR
jgi:hypothetical protein